MVTFDSGTVGLFPAFLSRLLPLDYFLPMLSLSRETTISMSSWRTQKDTAHAKAAKWVRRMIRVYTHPSSQRFMSLSHARTRLRAQQRAFQKFFCSCFTGPFWLNETYSKFVKSKLISSLVFSSDHCTDVMMYKPFCWMNAVPFTVQFVGLKSAVCCVTQQENKWSFALEQIAEVFSTIPRLYFLLVSVETLKPFKLLVISAKERTL